MIISNIFYSNKSYLFFTSNLISPKILGHPNRHQQSEGGAD